MNIDWSKAPEWTIGHALYAFGGEIYEAWVGESQYQRLDHPKPFPYGDVGVGGAQPNPRRSWFKYATPRPTAWTGEGLPPAGIDCEALSARTNTFRKCAVLAHRMGMAVVSFLDQEELQWIKEARPIRTPEQIAAEERAAAVSAMLADAGVTDSAWNDDPETLVWAEALYDAGYRKQVAP